jgi:iron complex outermembrane receptor protein
MNEPEDGSKNLPLIPAARLIDEIKVDFLKKGKLVRNGFIKFEVDNVFRQNNPFTGYNTEIATPGYSLLNAGISAEIMRKDKKLFSIFFGVNNITDLAYQSHLSRLKYAPENLATGRNGVFNMGRNFFIKWNMPLEVVK